MVETISPVVHGGRTFAYWRNVGLHALGSVAGAGSVGAVLGGLGAVAGAPWGRMGMVLIVGVATLYGIRDLFSAPIPLPDLRRQVPEWWRTFFPLPVTSLLYGLGLGTAFFTYLSYGTFVVVGAAALVGGDPLLGTVMTAPFGLGRALVVVAGDIETVRRRQQDLLGGANGLASAAIAVGVALLVFG